MSGTRLGKVAKALRPNFTEWEVVIERRDAATKLAAHAEDAAGNVEQHPHVMLSSTDQ